MKKAALLITIFIQLVTAGRTSAQMDPHFSQYYAYPLWLNPALTGVIDGDTRVNANFRNQWASVSNGYKTGALSADLRPTEKVGLGFNMINEAAGTAGYNYFLAAYASFGYNISISPDGYQKLHFGLQAGFINRSFDPSKLQFDDQFNPITGFDPNAPSFENFSMTSATVFDAGAGVFYYDGDPTDAAQVFAGASVAHLNGARDPFAGDGINSKLPMRYTLHGGVRIKATDVFDVIPHAVYIRERDSQIRAFGVYSELKFENNNRLILGGMYRLQDAAVADVGFHLNNMVIGVSYDFNTSPLRTATGGQGGFELSLSYIFKHKINPAVDIPKF